MPPKVALMYGFGEGDYHGRAFVAEIQKQGMQIVRNPAKADVVVTHSGGCFFLPSLDLNQKFVLINPPYWPGKFLAVSTLEKIGKDFMDYAHDGKIVQWLWKTAVNMIHILRYLIKTITITLGAHKQRFYEALRDESTIVIRSDADPFLSPQADQLLMEKYGRVIPFYRLPGQHDACWRDPKPYVDIIKRFAASK